jgi:uncharacterized protein YbjT (DUF2867 family)
MYVVLGASGHVGSAVADELIRLHEPVTVVLRDQQKAPHWTQRGAKVAICDVKDTAALRSVFKTGRRAFLLNPPAPPSTDTDRNEHRTFESIVRAVDGSGLETVVVESTYGARAGTRIGDLSVLFDFEQAVKAGTVASTILRAAYYMSNWDALLESAQKGVLPTFFPENLSLPMVAPADIGKAAASLLRQDPLDPGTQFVEGPARYTSADVAAAFTAALGRTVELSVIPRDQWEETYIRLGFSKAAADSYTRMTAASIDGGFDLPAQPIRGNVTLTEYIQSLAGRRQSGAVQKS